MAERTSFDVATPPGGWTAPWPNVAEIERVLPHTRWTLVGGLMAQLYAFHHGIGEVRPTSDVDMVLHVETTRGVAGEAARALESLGYELQAVDRSASAHRFVRGDAIVDLAAGRDDDVVDVLVADHAAPRVVERLRGHRMIAIEGGTQALRRTVHARLQIDDGRVTTVSVPSPYAAVVLKAAAHRSDPRDRVRHLEDAVVLLSVIADPRADRASAAGSDRSRLLWLARALADDPRPWRLVPEPWRSDGVTALRILTS
ncbi:hypothetical protein RDV89_06090 [Nocardioides zeae]|uniref:Nucleotidyltransferase-like protein n=1 Tax=Nocardioides imazamoxiresistens TaxID=3231893 RepID=A0ABU3PUQ2_9ACTN|nr:hypothetical protein [Nocardioides zeae]MDT9592626.1 hypothetical protein [Nocardioides zeae]